MIQQGFLVLLFATIFIACDNKNVVSTEANDNDAMAISVTRPQLTNGSWMLTTLEGEPVALKGRQRSIRLKFNNEGQVSGFAGCNPFTGAYKLEDGLRLSLQNIGVGLSMCDDSTIEGQLLNILNTIDNFDIKDDQLMLIKAKRAPMAIFSRITDEAITNKYWKLRTLDGKAVTMRDNQDREQFYSSRI